MGIHLSKQHGLNPSVELCHVCGKEMGVALLGRLKGDAEAPKYCSLGNVCPKCQEMIEKGGIFFIEVRDGSDKENPFRTGRLVSVYEERVKTIFTTYAKVNYLEASAFENLFGRFLEKSSSTSK